MIRFAGPTFIARSLFVLAGILLTHQVANATPVTTDVIIPYSTSGLFNGNWSGANNGASIAAAATNGNTGTGITFADWQDKFNDTLPGQTTTFSIPNVALGSDAVVNTLINNFYGDSGTDAVVTFRNNLGATQSFTLIGGTTTRDYNQNGFQNNLANGTSGVYAQNWWNNGNSGQRLDLQTFTLSSSWSGSSLVSMSIYNPTSASSNTSPQDVLSAVQVVTSPAALTPEPSSLALLGTGVIGAASFLRRRKRTLLLE